MSAVDHNFLDWTLLWLLFWIFFLLFSFLVFTLMNRIYFFTFLLFNCMFSRFSWTVLTMACGAIFSTRYLLDRLIAVVALEFDGSDRLEERLLYVFRREFWFLWLNGLLLFGIRRSSPFCVSGWWHGCSCWARRSVCGQLNVDLWYIGWLYGPWNICRLRLAGQCHGQWLLWLAE